MNTKFSLFFCFLFILSLNLIFAGGNSEPVGVIHQNRRPLNFEIVLQNPPIGSGYILTMQNRLLQLGFDLRPNSFYDVATDNVVKEIKYFLGYPDEHQGVDYDLWYFISNNEDTTILENIGTILSYNKMRLVKSSNLSDPYSGIGDYGSEAFVYHSGDNTPKKLEYFHGTEYTTLTLTGYFLNVNNYFVKYVYVTPNPSDRVEKMYYFGNNTLYEVRNGTIVPSNERNNIETVNGIINRFRSAYR